MGSFTHAAPARRGHCHISNGIIARLAHSRSVGMSAPLLRGGRPSDDTHHGALFTLEGRAGLTPLEALGGDLQTCLAELSAPLQVFVH